MTVRAISLVSGLAVVWLLATLPQMAQGDDGASLADRCIELADVKRERARDRKAAKLLFDVCTESLGDGHLTSEKRAEVLFTRALANLGLGQWQEAFDDASLAIEYAPDRGHLYLLRGFVLTSRKGRSESDLKMALADFDLSLALRHDNSTLREYRAKAHDALKEHAKVVEDIDALQSLEDQLRTEHLVLRGRAYFALGAYASAAADLEIAFNDKDASIETRYEVFEHLLRATCAHGEQDRALELYEQAILEGTLYGGPMDERILAGVQSKLKAAGLYAGPLDGKLSPEFHSAMRTLIRSCRARMDDPSERG